MAKAAEDLTIQEQIEYHERHIAVLQNHLNTSVAGPHEKQYVADLEQTHRRGPKIDLNSAWSAR